MLPDAWQTVSREDDATDRCVVSPTLGLVRCVSPTLFVIARNHRAYQYQYALARKE